MPILQSVFQGWRAALGDGSVAEITEKRKWRGRTTWKAHQRKSLRNYLKRQMN